MTRCSRTALFLCLIVSVARAQTAVSSDNDDARRQKVNAAYEEAERTLTIRVIDRCLADAKTTASLLADVKARASALGKRLTELRTNDEGKHLAAGIDVLTARELQHLLDQPPVRQELLDALGDQLKAATDSLTKLRDAPPAGFIPSDAQQDEVTRMRVTLTDACARVTERSKWLDGLIAAAPRTLDVSKAPTLDAAIVELRRREQLDWNQAQQLGIELARPEAREQITSVAHAAELERALEYSRQLIQDTRAELEQSRLENDMRIAKLQEEGRQRETELKAKLAEAEAARAVKDAQTDVFRRNGERDADLIRKRQECKSPEILGALAPFTAPGYTQPGSKELTRERGPVSWKALQASGALNPSEAGLRVLFSIGFNPAERERPNWPFVRLGGYNSAIKAFPANREHLVKVQEYLIKYGEALQQEGYLAP